jgi:hypothetical protein
MPTNLSYSTQFYGIEEYFVLFLQSNISEMKINEDCDTIYHIKCINILEMD